LIVDYRNDWKTLVDATKSDVWTGGALINIATLTLLLFLAFALRDAAHEVRRGSLGENSGEWWEPLSGDRDPPGHWHSGQFLAPNGYSTGMGFEYRHCPFRAGGRSPRA
jgi:hypothetical protein